MVGNDTSQIPGPVSYRHLHSRTLYLAEATPSRWQDIDADGQFSFSLQQGFTKTDKTGVEKYLREYYRGETRLLFIWGDTASPAYRERRRPEMRDYQELTTRLKGKQANVRTYWLSQGGKRF